MTIMQELVRAMYEKNIKKVREICSQNPTLINEPCNKHGWTPFMLICKFCNEPKWIKTALKLGGDVNTRNPDGLTPFLITVRSGADIQSLEILLDIGKANINDIDNEGLNALMIAAIHPWGRYMNAVMIEYLVDKGIDLDHKANDGRTIFDVAVGIRTKEFISLYIQKKKYFDSIGKPMTMKDREEIWYCVANKIKHYYETKKIGLDSL